MIGMRYAQRMLVNVVVMRSIADWFRIAFVVQLYVKTR